MAVAQMSISEENRDRLFGRAEALFEAALDDFSRQVRKAQDECDSPQISRYADAYREARALAALCPINSAEGVRARQLLFGLIACITSVLASDCRA